MEEKSLVKELVSRIKLSKKTETEEDIRKREFLNYLTKERGSFKDVEKYYLTDKEYYELLAFYKFIKNHPQISAKEVKVILNQRCSKFDLLRKLMNYIPTLADEIYFGGPTRVIIMYYKEMLRIENFKKQYGNKHF